MLPNCKINVNSLLAKLAEGANKIGAHIHKVYLDGKTAG